LLTGLLGELLEALLLGDDPEPDPGLEGLLGVLPDALLLGEDPEPDPGLEGLLGALPDALLLGEGFEAEELAGSGLPAGVSATSPTLAGVTIGP
jgi:hypothetical protein